MKLSRTGEPEKDNRRKMGLKKCPNLESGYRLKRASKSSVSDIFEMKNAFSQIVELTFARVNSPVFFFFVPN